MREREVEREGEMRERESLYQENKHVLHPLVHEL
jgi:hypothetical protein